MIGTYLELEVEVILYKHYGICCWILKDRHNKDVEMVMKNT